MILASKLSLTSKEIVRTDLLLRQKPGKTGNL